MKTGRTRKRKACKCRTATGVIAPLKKKRAGKAIKDKMCHLLEKDCQQTRNLLTSVTVNRNVVNNLLSSQNQQEDDVW